MPEQIRIFYDVETTGLDFRSCCIHQLSGIIEINGKIVESFDLKFRPSGFASIESKALEVSGLIEADLFNRPISYSAAFEKFLMILDKYISKYDQKQKAVLVGYNNLSFDTHFLRKFFLDNEHYYFGSYFYNDEIDVRSLAILKLHSVRHEMLNFKLCSILDILGISYSLLHDAMFDVCYTRDAFYKLIEGFYNV